MEAEADQRKEQGGERREDCGSSGCLKQSNLALNRMGHGLSPNTSIPTAFAPAVQALLSAALNPFISFWPPQPGALGQPKFRMHLAQGFCSVWHLFPDCILCSPSGLTHRLDLPLVQVSTQQTLNSLEYRAPAIGFE